MVTPILMAIINKIDIENKILKRIKQDIIM